MYQPVTFAVSTITGTIGPLAGVVVKILSQDGKLFYTQAVSDSDGMASFLLAAGQTYQARFFKFQVGFSNPQLFFVNDDNLSNVFSVPATVLVPPVAADARLCRASGFFRDATGAPAANIDIHFIAKFKPLLLEGSAILTERAVTRTDQNGFMQLDLIRCGQYDITAQGMEDLYRTIYVPNAPSVNLPDLLFPVVSQVVFTPPGPYTVMVGVDQTIAVQVLASDGETLKGTAAQDVIWQTDDPSIVAVLDMNPVLILRAFKSGTTNLTATRRDTTIVRIPNSPILGSPQVITVP